MVEQARDSNAEVDYERTDVPLRPLLIIALALVILLGSAPFIILLGFSSTANDVDRRLMVLPPEPRLQTHPREDLDEYLSREQVLLDSYGWVDRAGGIVRVPITVAMRRLAQQGIAGFQQATPQQHSSQGAP
jgi:hypothetical protein